MYFEMRIHCQFPLYPVLYWLLLADISLFWNNPWCAMSALCMFPFRCSTVRFDLYGINCVAHQVCRWSIRYMLCMYLISTKRQNVAFVAQLTNGDCTKFVFSKPISICSNSNYSISLLFQWLYGSVRIGLATCF